MTPHYLPFFAGLAALLFGMPSYANEFSREELRWLQGQVAQLDKEKLILQKSRLRSRSFNYPEHKDPALRARLDAAAHEQGLDPKRIVLIDDHSEQDRTELSGAFVYIQAKTIRDSEDALRFTLAHEWAHVEQEHPLTRFKLLLMSAAQECFACVKRQGAVAAVLAYSERNPLATAAYGRPYELEADTIAVRQLATLGYFPDYAAVFKDAYGNGVCVRYDTDSHPSCENRTKNAYRILASEFARQLPPPALAQTVMNGGFDKTEGRD